MADSKERTTGGVGKAAVVRAAVYVRMSTERQEYSTENQTELIQEFAARRGIEIVRTYADEGKSGLTLEGRPALKRLLNDVQSGKADFTTILVYDVSRWGRFQNPDESGYHEHSCNRAGITIQFCAEQFENDGSLSSTIFKTVKRAMASEYSRELSVKVFAGQCRLIEVGVRQGGPAGYGLRRQLIDQAGNSKALLGRGEQKSLQTDRVILVPGPPEEVRTVRWMYRMFVEGGKNESEIAATLNERGLRSDLNRPWTRGTVHQVLINEKYIGNNVWNKGSFKLKKKRVRNSPELWVRANGAFKPIVERSLFDAAQAIIAERSRRFSDEELLEVLRQLLAEHDCLSGLIIDEREGAPSSSAYQNRFGSLIRAYQLVGYTPERDYRYIEINRFLRRMHPQVVASTISGIEGAGGQVTQDLDTDLLTINGEFTTSIVIVRCRHTPAGSLRWHVRLDTGLHPDITVAIRMDEANGAALDYYMLPRIDMSRPRLQLARNNGIELDAFRFDTLEPLFALTARTNILKVA